MVISEVTKEEYSALLLEKDTKNIDGSQYSDVYLKLNDAYCGLHFQKNNIAQINGLFSLSKGDGSILMYHLVEEYSILRLNCNSNFLENYYSYFGFKTYLSFENGFREMILIGNLSKSL